MKGCGRQNTRFNTLLLFLRCAALFSKVDELAFTDSWQRLREREIELLENTAGILAPLDAKEDDLHLLKQSVSDLKDAFMLVIVGEFNR